jgi:rod shape-determining protein MreC
MEGFLNRYRNITVLLLVLFAQLVLLAVQVKNDQDVRMIRVWTVTAVTPVARGLESVRAGGLGFLRNYVLLHRADEENRQLHEEIGRLRVENIYLKNELNRADRAKALEMFQSQTPSKMLAATVIATGAGPNSKVVFVDRGSVSGVMRGMGVVTPDGIVGKVIAAYPTTSEIVLVTDSEFAAGVVSQKNQARGTLKGDGTPLCRVDYVPPEQALEAGELFFTSGDDRVFPRGFPVGVVKAVRSGTPFKDIVVEPTGIQKGLEDVLIVMNPVHQDIPDFTAASQPVYIAPPPPDSGKSAPAATGSTSPIGTEADKLRNIYKAVGEQQGHNYGEGGVGSKPPDFLKLPNQVPSSTTPASGASGATGPARPQTPAANGPTGATRPPAPAAAPTGPTTAPPKEPRKTNPTSGGPGGPIR